MRFLIKTLVVAATVLGVSYFFYGIHVRSFWSALLFAVVLGLLNAFLKPLLGLITLPLKILTMGLFTLILNTFLFWLASLLIGGVEIRSYVAAFFGALLISIVSFFLNKNMKKKDSKNIE